MNVPVETVIQNITPPFINFAKSTVKRKSLRSTRRPILPKSYSINQIRRKTNLRQLNFFPFRQSSTGCKLESHFKSPIIIKKQLASNAEKYLKNFKFNSSVFSKVKEAMSENTSVESVTLPNLSEVEQSESASVSVITDNSSSIVINEEDKAEEKVCFFITERYVSYSYTLIRIKVLDVKKLYTYQNTNKCLLYIFSINYCIMIISRLFYYI